MYSVLHAGDASTSLTERALELTAWVHPPHPTSQASADVRPSYLSHVSSCSRSGHGQSGWCSEGVRRKGPVWLWSTVRLLS